MNAGYVDFIPILFPNVKINIDRFHIIQLINHSLNHIRVMLMNQFHASNGENMKKNRRLKLVYKKKEKQQFAKIKKENLDIHYNYFILSKKSSNSLDSLEFTFLKNNFSDSNTSSLSLYLYHLEREGCIKWIFDHLYVPIPL